MVIVNQSTLKSVFLLPLILSYSGQSLLSSLRQIFKLKRSHLFRHVFAVADGGLKLGGVGIAGHVDDDFNVVGRRSSFELGLRLHHDLHPRVSVTLDDRLNPDQRLDLQIRQYRENRNHYRISYIYLQIIFSRVKTLSFSNATHLCV